MPAKRRLVLGSRGSPLALWQANLVKNLLEEEYGDLSVTIKAIKTTGDKVRKTPLAEIGGKSLFIKEIEEQLLEEKIHVGVHSMKDVPVILPKGLTIGAILKREDSRDVFVSKKYDSLLHLPKRAKIGTSSLRRQAQLKNFRPDLEIVPLRGNVETRLRKLTAGEFDAVVLSAAGLTRLSLAKKITEYLPTSLMLPAVGQGAIGLEVREEDDEIRRLIDFLNDIETVHCIQAERSFLKAIEGDCRAPVAAFAEIDGQTLKLTGMIASIDGRELIRDRLEGNIRDAVSLGEQLARQLFGHGAREILRSCREKLSNP
jgi:hydroxymethylbilane synthase